MGQSVSDKPKSTVLVVEDEPLIRMLTAYLLREGGFEVLEAGTGAEALDLLANGHRVGLILTDIRMPGVDGITLSQRVRSSHPKIPIVFVTGEAALDKEQLAGRPCLSKPLTPDELMAAVNEAINLNEVEGG